jgi:hypothetical protein
MRLALHVQELDVHLTNWAQLLGDRYGFVTGKSSLQPSPVNSVDASASVFS